MQLTPGHLRSVNLAHVRTGDWANKPGRTGIDKRPVAHRVATRRDHLQGDTIADLANHGGPDQAVYAYAVEDARWWGAQLSREVAPGAFGENLTVEGVAVTDAVVGQQWHVGSAVFEVSVPRIPCRVFAWFWDVPDLVKRFTQAARPGAYLRVVVDGEVGPGDEIFPGAAPEHGLTIGETFRALTGERELAAKLLTAPELPAAVHARARTWLGQPAVG